MVFALYYGSGSISFTLWKTWHGKSIHPFATRMCLFRVYFTSTIYIDRGFLYLFLPSFMQKVYWYLRKHYGWIYLVTHGTIRGAHITFSCAFFAHVSFLVTLDSFGKCIFSANICVINQLVLPKIFCRLLKFVGYTLIPIPFTDCH